MLRLELPSLDDLTNSFNLTIDEYLRQQKETKLQDSAEKYKEELVKYKKEIDESCAKRNAPANFLAYIERDISNNSKDSPLGVDDLLRIALAKSLSLHLGFNQKIWSEKEDELAFITSLTLESASDLDLEIASEIALSSNLESMKKICDEAKLKLNAILISDENNEEDISEVTEEQGPDSDFSLDEIDETKKMVQSFAIAINQYLDIDNPQPAETKKPGLFNKISSGIESIFDKKNGRDRAIAYVDIMKNYQKQCPANADKKTFLAYIAEDILNRNANSPLGTSHQLRLRLAKLLGLYFGVDVTVWDVVMKKEKELAAIATTMTDGRQNASEKQIMDACVDKIVSNLFNPELNAVIHELAEKKLQTTYRF